ncbi:hypothetical protein KIPB_005558 [Kipferlia bialata]|uniref:PH domain-containing protein n=1 Tax=Kipferlia bialata TaxID=797122 RepID=A0A9K3GJ53_9EUKA|nr:hypothetical protein KIPB_005558 [Kipferlia bialata]|eukprot:g5558.t1
MSDGCDPVATLGSIMTHMAQLAQLQDKHSPTSPHPLSHKCRTLCETVATLESGLRRVETRRMDGSSAAQATSLTLLLQTVSAIAAYVSTYAPMGGAAWECVVQRCMTVGDADGRFTKLYTQLSDTSVTGWVGAEAEAEAETETGESETNEAGEAGGNNCHTGTTPTPSVPTPESVVSLDVCDMRDTLMQVVEGVGRGRRSKRKRETRATATDAAECISDAPDLGAVRGLISHMAGMDGGHGETLEVYRDLVSVVSDRLERAEEEEEEEEGEGEGEEEGTAAPPSASIDIKSLVFQPKVPLAPDRHTSFTGHLSGWLYKRGAVRKSWKRRWFTVSVEDPLIRYYASPTDPSPKGAILVSHLADIAVAEPSPSSWDRPMIRLVQPDRTWWLVVDGSDGAETVRLQQEWYEALSAMVVRSRSAQ